jgi:phosphoribosyl 1,2-cyclic phosphodiesterase
MNIKIWGSRGSIPTPGPTTLRYGGNTTCLELRTALPEVIIVDAGSGLRNLGKALCQNETVTALRLFLTHLHWDHVVGFPFFEPAYDARYTITFCGGPHAQECFKQRLARQMQAPFFPVDFSMVKATFRTQCTQAHDGHGECRHGQIEVCPVPLSHPNGGHGYKFSEAGKVFVFLTDNELGVQHEGGLSRSDYVDFCQGADLLIHDAQYTDEEYTRTRGWGHSTYADAVDLAIAAGVRRLGLFHHDPDRTDDDLDRQVEKCQQRIRAAGASVECFGCVEGMQLAL